MTITEETEEDTTTPKPTRGAPAGSENAKHGGQTVAKKYGPDFYRRIGQKGGSTTAKRYGSEHYSNIGQTGGKTTLERHGGKHFANMGRKGGQANKGKSKARGPYRDKADA